jgi:hypothetical protein
VADDIVPSLRASAQWIKDIEHESWFETADIQIQAADEIERLRAAGDYLASHINDVVELSIVEQIVRNGGATVPPQLIQALNTWLEVRRD